MTDTANLLATLGMTHEMRDCPKHGPYMGFRIEQEDGTKTRWSICPRCKAENPDLTDRVVFNKDAEHRMLVRQLTLDACIPPVHEESTFENYVLENQNQLDAMQACRDVVHGFVQSLLVFGPTGVGKTHLAVASIHEAIERERSARYVSEPVLFGEFLEAREARMGGDRQLLRRFSSYDLLVIDEVGKKELSEYQASVLFELIDDRWNNNKSTIYCGNITSTDFRTHFTDPMRSRIRNNGAWVRLIGTDHRAKKDLTA